MIFKSFLGATTPYGFTGYFEELCRTDNDLHTYIIKGGPGCGKSSMMKRIGEKLEANGYDAEYVHCSSDPSSLDGIICEKLHLAIADGTAPHVLEPKIPAAYHSVISLYDCIDESALEAKRDELSELFSKNARCFERANRFISASASLFGDISRTSAGFLLMDKLERYIANLTRRLFLPNEGGGASLEKNRFLTALTPEGIASFTRENLATCTYRYVLKDRYGAFAQTSLKLIHEAAAKSGLQTVVCRSFLSPSDKYEALFFPSLSLCFVTDSFIAPLSAEGCRIIHDERFYDKSVMKNSANRLAFCKKTILCLLTQGGEILREAKRIHDEIEAFYKRDFDYEKLHKREEALCAKYGLF